MILIPSKASWSSDVFGSSKGTAEGKTGSVEAKTRPLEFNCLRVTSGFAWLLTLCFSFLVLKLR